MKHTQKYHFRRDERQQLIVWAIMALTLLLIGFVAPKLSAESTEPKCTLKTGLAHTSVPYQFSIRFPKKWKGNYQVCEITKTGANLTDFQVSVRKNKSASFKELFVLHVWDTSLLGEGEAVAGEKVSAKTPLLVTVETTTSSDLSKYTKEVPNILKGFRWVSFQKFGEVLQKIGN